MPEGPEVETVIRSFKHKVIGQKIINIDLIYKPIASNSLLPAINQTIKDVFRKGKFIVIQLDKGFILIHLRMEGKLLFDQQLINDKHVHCIIKLSHDYMFYHDVRKFGRLGYYLDLDDSPVSKLGPDALNISAQQLYTNIHNKKKAIKTVLLDQSVVAGIGNIYASEICFLAKINPFLSANLINMAQCEKIVESTHSIISKAIDLGGSSIHSFYDSEGISGRFQNELLVYGKNNHCCPVCHQQIKKVKLDQRGTYYCEKCQK